MRHFLAGLLILLLVAPVVLAAKRTTRSRSRRQVSTRSARSAKSRRHTRSRASRHRRHRARVARQTQPDSVRTREIQEALRRQGYLTNPASGRWDEPTRAAMARYQQDHGFRPTGKPDSRSLIKLGLGPKHANAPVAPSTPATPN